MNDNGGCVSGAVGVKAGAGVFVGCSGLGVIASLVALDGSSGGVKYADAVDSGAFVGGARIIASTSGCFTTSVKVVRNTPRITLNCKYFR